jgi:hypothetical protein
VPIDSRPGGLAAVPGDGQLLRASRAAGDRARALGRTTVLAGAAMLFPLAATAATCLDTATGQPAGPRARALAEFALAEHAAFGGQAVDVEGRLTRAGRAEGEDTRAPRSTPAPWERVLDYWRAVGPESTLPDAVGYGALRPARRHLLVQALRQASSARLHGMGAAPGQGLESSELLAVEAALARVAVIDTPWSAAFISWLAREAGLGRDEFVFSEAHADYAGAAWRATRDESAGRATPYAFRACDPATTPPRVGDLLCHARGGAARLDTFAALGEVLSRRPDGGGALPMHCDAVVRVDASGFDAVGGNVLQSVTLRRMSPEAVLLLQWR